MFNLSVDQLLHNAGNNPIVQSAAIILGTFVLEDAATVLAAMRVQDSSLTWHLALASLYVGIILGDFGLYGLGALAARVRWARRLIPEQRQERGRRWIEARVFRVVFISRFIPGARLPTYTACGFLGASFRAFALASVIATLIWTSALFGISLRVGKVLMEHFGAWRWAGAVGFAVVIVAMGRLAAKMQGEQQ